MPDEPSGAGAENTGAGSGQAATTSGTNEADLLAKIETALQGSEGYKGLQRAFDKQQKSMQQLLGQKDAEIANLRAAHASVSENMDYVNKVVLEALPQAQREAVESDLRNKQIQNLQREQQALRKQMETPVPVAQQDDFTEQLNQLRKDAVDTMRDTAQSHGVDPNDKGLNYGEQDEPFPARLRKLNQSIAVVKKAKEDAEVESVRQKTAQPPTRTGGAAAPGEFSGKTLLASGAQELLERVRKGDFRSSRTLAK